MCDHDNYFIYFMFRKYNGFVSKARVSACMYFLVLYIVLFNISDKVLFSLDIVLEFTEFFKMGHPIGNVIHAKLITLKAKCEEVSGK